VVVLEVRAWLDLGTLERLILGFGGFGVFFFFSFFLFFFFSFFLFFYPRLCLVRGGMAIGPDTRYNCWVLWAGKEVPCFCFMRWVGDVGWISGWLVV